LRPSEESWGAVELAARYSALSVDADAFPLYADPARSAREARSWGAAANWYLNANARIGFNLDHTSFEGGATEGDRPSETVLLSRFQLSW
jgi:phosphate-selective porin OprO and OprP